MTTGWCYMHNGRMGSVGESCVCGREESPPMDPAPVRELEAALARKDALLRQAMEALTTAASEMRDWHCEHPARKEIDAAFEAIADELKEPK